MRAARPMPEGFVLNFQYSLLVAPSLFTLMSSVHSGLGRPAVAWCIQVKNPDVEECMLMPLPSKPCALTSSRAPSSKLIGCPQVQTLSSQRLWFHSTLWQTAERHLIVMSLSWCLSAGNPLCEQLRACSTVCCLPHTQLDGMCGGCQP